MLKRSAVHFRRIHAVGLAGASLLLLAGCATTGAREHVVQVGAAAPGTGGLRPGDTAPDFVFTTESGNASRFSEVRGRVTVVLFPNQPGEWLDPHVYAQLAGMGQSLSGPQIPVVLIDVGRPHRTEAQARQALEAAPVASDRLVLLADPEGSIRALFGPHAGGRFYVIDNFDRIVSVGEFQRPRDLDAPVEQAVRTVADEDAEFQEHG